MRGSDENDFFLGSILACVIGFEGEKKFSALPLFPFLSHDFKKSEAEASEPDRL